MARTALKQNGLIIWSLYKGEKDLGMAEVMSKIQIMIQENKNLPEWFSLDKSMTREIVIMIPNE